MQRLIVTLDGPAGSGKSSVARLLAQRLNVDFLDTGAMYRGITAAAIDRGLDPARQAEAVATLARQLMIDFDWQADPPHLLIDGRDMHERLRDNDVTAAVSDIAAIGAVREVLVQAQRQIGQSHPRLVTEGRDQGSIVFPNAEIKFFLEASVDVRAHRRAKQLREAGQTVDLDAIRASIMSRDHKDSTRKDGPLICPADAIRVDTSDMTLDEVVDDLERRVRQKLELVR